MFFEDFKTFYLSNLLEESSHHKVFNHLSNAETQLKIYETSYSLLLASSVCMSSKHLHVYSNYQLFYLDRQISSQQLKMI